VAETQVVKGPTWSTTRSGTASTPAGSCRGISGRASVMATTSRLSIRAPLPRTMTSSSIRSAGRGGIWVRIRTLRGPLTVVAIAGFVLAAAFVHPNPTPAVSTAALPADVQDQLNHLSPGTVIVPCSPSVAVLPEGVRPLTTLGFSFGRPGFRFLLHGYCADNPSATPIPVNVQSVGGTP
jgi:hypothetical protein